MKPSWNYPVPYFAESLIFFWFLGNVRYQDYSKYSYFIYRLYCDGIEFGLNNVGF